MGPSVTLPQLGRPLSAGRMTLTLLKPRDEVALELCRRGNGRLHGCCAYCGGYGELPP